MKAAFGGEVALVTGGGRGIGRATAMRLARGGAKVIITYESDDASARSTVEAIEAEGFEAASLRFDVADSAACKEAVAEVTRRFGGPHVLVNNAGASKDGLVMRLRDEDWDRTLAVNLSGAFYMSRAAIRPMLKQRRGSIVNVCSLVAVTGNPGQAAYAAAKGGLISLTKTLARELAGRNIRVNAVAPGLIETDMTASMNESAKDEAIASVPLGRAGTAEEVAEAIAFLASDDAAYVTGHVFHVNGGLLM